MDIKKKSLDTLKQQKKSFINFIKNKEKYSEAIADLFYDGEIEKIDNMDGVRHHLEQKGISKELIDSLESDYVGYLRSQSYYGSMDESTEELRQSIKENDKKLKEIKRDIVREYKYNEEFLFMDIEQFIKSGLKLGDGKNRRNLDLEIDGLKKEINYLNEEVQLKETLILTLKKELNGTNIFQQSKKKRLNQNILDNEKNIEKLKQEIEKKEKSMREKSKLNVKIIKELLYGDHIKAYVGGKDWSNIKSCKKSMDEINHELASYIDYVPQESVDKIIRFVLEAVFESVKLHKNALLKRINDYLNYFYYGKDKNQGFVGYCDCHYREGRYYISGGGVSLYRVEPTIYSKSRIDPDVVGVINKLCGGIDGRNMYEELIDCDFMNDVFIHTTGFNVLDEILEEGGLVSTNEAQKRRRNNSDINDSITQEHAHHKDVYFSRGFRKNGYGHHESGNDDFVFIANTMNNFACSGYGVPLSNNMQPNASLEDVDACHDTYGYSIISKSALKKSFWDDSYSKIDVKDLYIFVPETKMDEIEKNPKYKKSDANIIYIPEKYYKGGMNYKLYEFIRNEIKARDEKKPRKSPVPNEIITDDNIGSINNGYKWAFCNVIGDAPEILFNPIKDGDYKTIINFFKINQDALGFSELKRFSGFEIDYKRLESFLDEQKVNIDSFEVPFEYPKELLLLAIICTKLGLWGESYSDSWKRTSLTRIKNKVKEFGYSMKDIGIMCKTVEWILYMVQFKDNLKFDKSLKKGHIDSIRKWCDEWSVDFEKMKDCLLKVSNISLRPYIYDSIKDILK